MADNWQKVFSDIKPAIAELGRLNPGILEGKRVLDGAGAKTNCLGRSTRELIAIAVSVTTRCNECVARHVQVALQHGSTKEEIAEAVGVAVALNTGAAVVYAAKAVAAAIQMSSLDAAEDVNTSI